jgi:drug/metabolite transporter (DMT)-like permease
MSTTTNSTSSRIGKETLGFIFGFIGVLCFSFSLPFTRVAVLELDPTFVGLGRALLAAALSAFFLLVKKQPVPTRRQLIRIAVVALGVVFGFPLFSAWALKFVPSAHGAIINALLPLMTAVFSVAISKDKPSWIFWFAAIVGSLTVIVFILVRSGTHIELGDFAMLAAVALGALGYVMGGRMSKEIGSWQTICWANVISVPVLIFPVGTVIAQKGLNASPQAWLAFVYLGAVSMCLGFFAWYRGLALGGITRVSQVQLLQAFLTILWSGLLLGETITPLMWVAALIVVTMIFVARKAPIRSTV